MGGTADGLRLDRGELAEGALPAAAMVGALGPGDDREAEPVAGLQRQALRTLFWSRKRKDSIAALSGEEATLPPGPHRPCRC